jgi:predicted transcriptional regulator
MPSNTFSIRMSDDKITRLDAMAEAMNRTRNHLINEAVDVYIAAQAWQIAHIQEGLADLDAGRMTPREDVEADTHRIIAEARARHAQAS